MLNEIRAYILHMRPKEWPVVAVHLISGMLCSLHLSYPDAIASLFIFVILLNGGTLALNSSFDKDEGDIAFLNNPPKPPKYLGLFGFILLFLSLYFSIYRANQSLGHKYFFEIVLTCILMSILYSVPPIRLKARPGFDLLINSLGFGFFTFLAGFVSMGNSLTSHVLKLAVGFGFLFGGLYPLTQIYQNREDSRRGDRTLTLWLGNQRALSFSMGFSIVAFLWLIWASLHDFLTIILLLLNLLIWLFLLQRWKRRSSYMSSDQHKTSMYIFLALWPLTDLLILASHFRRY